MSSIDGIDRLMHKLSGLGGDTDRALRAAILQTAKKVQGDAKDLCPVDSGALRNSIQARVENIDGKPAGMVSTGMEYAPYVEFGTGQRGQESPSPPKYDGPLAYRQDWTGNKAQPFLYPAASMSKAIYPKLVAKQLQKEIKRLEGPG